MSQGEKTQWKIGLIGFGAGMLVMLAGNTIVNLMGKDNNQLIKKEILQEQEKQQESVDETELNQSVVEKAEDVKNGTGIKTGSNVEIPKNFAENLILYQYIEYGVRKYSEDNKKNDRYYCDIKEDWLPYDTEFSMKKEGDIPYKTDLSKEIIPELVNNIYNFKLEGQNDTIYMAIDTYNMKIYVYDKIK
ncbi:MAG: hypothetical protein HDQ97_02770 [Lachnospiraceae bacterium]|nr:hypothetical protein [Lachnospiraceae bacterium]